MADQPAKPAPLPMDTESRTYGFDRAGRTISVPKGQEAAFAQMGGRMAADDELADIAQAKATKQLDAMDAAEGERLRGLAAKGDVAGLLAGTASKALDKVGTSLGAGIAGGGVLGLAAGTLGSENRKVQAFAQGGVDAATLGTGKLLGKALQRAVGGDEASKRTVERYEALEAAEPGANMAGQVGGMITQSIVTAGAGRAGGAARWLNPLTAGEAAEAAAARQLAGLATKGVLGKAAAKGLSLGVQGAIDGAIFSGADEVTDAMFADKQLTAEKLAAAVGHGALLGGITGAGLGFAGGLGSGIAGKARDGLTRFAERRATAAREMATGAAERVASESAERGAEQAAKAVGEGSGGVRLIGREADDAAYRALGGTRKNVRRVVEQLGEGGEQKLGKFVSENYLQPAAKEQGLVRGIIDSTPETLLPKIQADVQTTGAQIGERLKSSTATVDMRAWLDKVRGLGEAARLEGAQGVAAVKRLGGVMQDLDEALAARGYLDPATGRIADNIPVHELATLRRDLAGVAYAAKAAGDTRSVKLLKEVERSMQDGIMESLSEAEREGLKTLNERYRMLKVAEEVAETGAERAKGNNRLGLRASIAGAVGLATSPLAGLVTAGGSHLLHRYGDAAAAVLLQRAAESGRVVRAVERIDNAISRAARGVVDGGAAKLDARGAARASRTSDPRPRAKALMARVQAAQADPVAFGDRIRASSGALRNAPELASSYEQHAVTAASFLASKLPRPLQQQDPLRPERTGQISKQDAAKFLRYAEAIQHPERVLQDLARGKVNREGVEAIRETSPQLYQQLQQQTLARVQRAAEAGRPMPYATRVRIGTVLGMPLDPSMRPQAMRALQRNVMAVESTDGAGSAPTGAPPQSPRRPLQSNVTTQQAGLDDVT